MKKYAVYRTETGFYCRRYCETPEDLTGSIFEGIVGEERFPVVLDGNSGYYPFSEHDPGFCEIIETDAEEPLPLEKKYFRNSEKFRLGWMSPDGDTYACGYTAHVACAEMLAKRFLPPVHCPERALGKAGWLKIIDSWDGTEEQHGQFVYSFTGRISKRQADVLFDLGLYNNPEVRELIAASENNW